MAIQDPEAIRYGMGTDAANQAGRDPAAQPIAGGGEIGSFPDEGQGIHLKGVQDQAVTGLNEDRNIQFLQLLQKDQQPLQVGDKSHQFLFFFRSRLSAICPTR